MSYDPPELPFDTDNQNLMRKFKRLSNAGITVGKCIGHGAFSCVYDIESHKDLVLKVTSCGLSAEYLRWSMKQSSVHLPKNIIPLGYANHGRLSIFIVERLYPLRGRQKVIARPIISRAGHLEGSVEFEEVISQLYKLKTKNLPLTMVDALTVLNSFIIKKESRWSIGIDLHDQNIMVRKDNTLVLNDPICNSDYC